MSRWSSSGDRDASCQDVAYRWMLGSADETPRRSICPIPRYPTPVAWSTLLRIRVTSPRRQGGLALRRPRCAAPGPDPLVCVDTTDIHVHTLRMPPGDRMSPAFALRTVWRRGNTSCTQRRTGSLEHRRHDPSSGSRLGLDLVQALEAQTSSRSEPGSSKPWYVASPECA